MEKEKKIVVYATTKNGEGFTEVVGKYDYLDEVSIRIGMFAPDVVLEFHYEVEDE